MGRATKNEIGFITIISVIKKKQQQLMAVCLFERL